ncbi:S9 family peptidase [Alicyclobacillus mengziensis]|uniref:S9 family peptidase n=1 Tax=Alicyclobacillus mengziensis TaxID=2931921 RepID=A0A9X7Z7H4_9BACL|nr:S9 family peptidase [Alicyclobacillus mengziensis]QSO49099.1 S9 family peptidase [Alicyclobacillus mengziensis]
MAKRGVSMDDLYRFEMVANPVVSPQGDRVVYEQTTTNRKTDEYETQLLIASIEGSKLYTLTSAGTKNTGAAWSPDGQTLAFISNRAGGVSQAWLLPLAGGEARQLTRFKNGVSSLVWTPDGKKLVALTPVTSSGSIETFETDMSAKDCEESNQKAQKEWAEGPKRYDRLYYKMDGMGLSKHRETQLVVIDVETGDFKQLTDGPHSVSGPAVSPDGKYVAFVSNRRENKDTDPERHSDVYRVPLDGGDLELLCSDTVGYNPSYSPDGSTITFFGNQNEFESATHTDIYAIPATGGAGVNLTAEFPDTIMDAVLSDTHPEVRAAGPKWSPDGKFLYALSSREGRTEVVRFSSTVGAGEAQVIIGGDRQVYGFDFADRTTAVIVYATQTHPGKLAVVKLSENEIKLRKFRSVTESMGQKPVAFFPAVETRLDNACNALFEEVEPVMPERFEFRSQDDWVVEGWVMKPYGYEAGKKYPVILDVHGGPQLQYGYGFFHEMQWFASQGYAVIFMNPRGSMGYGQEFVNAVRHHYGEGDAADVQNSVEAAIAQFDFLDGSRVGVTGGSYGGFMTNWLVGHTDRFFAAVAQRSISNWISFYGVSDIGPLFVEAQLGGDIFTEREKLWRMSPLAYANEVKTPLLLLHSENDLRCPMEQAEQFYTAIKRRGGEVELFRIPNASHGLSRNGKPKLRQERLQAIFGYINDRLPKQE